MTDEPQALSGPLVRIDVFEGPLQLLLYLVERYEIDIHDVPISAIADQYFEYIFLMKRLNLEVAGEFLMMATRLMQMKLANLLSSRVTSENDELALRDESADPLDTPEQLALRLAEYRKYRDLAESLRVRFEEWGNTFSAGYPVAREREEILFRPLRGFHPSTLADSLCQLQSRRSLGRVHRISRTPFTVSRKIRFLLAFLKKVGGKTTFSAIRSRCSRAELVASFLAILELARKGRIAIRQSAHLGEISISLIKENGDRATRALRGAGEKIGFS